MKQNFQGCYKPNITWIHEFVRVNEICSRGYVRTVAPKVIAL